MQNFPKVLINDIKNSIGQYNKSLILNKSFLSCENNSFFSKKKERNFSHSMVQNGKSKSIGHLLEIIFHGLNYSAKRLKLFRKKFSIDVHKSEIFLCNEPIVTPIKSRIYKRRLVFFSYDKQQLYKIQRMIKDLKMPNSYTGKGLFSRQDTYATKKGKKR